LFYFDVSDAMSYQYIETLSDEAVQNDINQLTFVFPFAEIGHLSGCDVS